MEAAQDFRIPRATVQGMNDEELFWAVIEPIWPDVSVNLEEELVRIEHGTPGQRALYATTLFAREVDNGGLAQFFQNSSGMYAKHVEEGLRTLGAKEMLSALLKAIRSFPNRAIPIDWEERRRTVQDMMVRNRELFRSADAELDKGPGIEEQLYPYFKKYIDVHPGEFFRD